MFEHILVPIDESATSRRAARKAIAFAAETGARVTGYHALPLQHSHQVYGEGYRFAHSGTRHKDLAAARERFLDSTADAARAAGVAFTALVERAESPPDGIVAVARKRKCDLIFMGSHGRRGLARLALGSVAASVLTRAEVPVLVCR
jgi:nucleotide-binding universal stress UspA family protein